MVNEKLKAVSSAEKKNNKRIVKCICFALVIIALSIKVSFSSPKSEADSLNNNPTGNAASIDGNEAALDTPADGVPLSDIMSVQTSQDIYKDSYEKYIPDKADNSDIQSKPAKPQQTIVQTSPDTSVNRGDQVSQDAVDESAGQAIAGSIEEQVSQVSPDTTGDQGSQPSPDTSEEPIDESAIIAPDQPCH